MLTTLSSSSSSGWKHCSQTDVASLAVLRTILADEERYRIHKFLTFLSGLHRLSIEGKWVLRNTESWKQFHRVCVNSRKGLSLKRTTTEVFKSTNWADLYFFGHLCILWFETLSIHPYFQMMSAINWLWLSNCQAFYHTIQLAYKSDNIE